jgi:hypothetical protein
MSVHSSSSRGLQVDMSMFTVVGSAYLAYIPRGVMERLKMYMKHKLGHEQRLPRWSVGRGVWQSARGAPECCGS